MSSNTGIHQRGAALFTSMVIMSIILLLAVSAAKFSTTSLKLAVNEEVRVAATERAQAVIDAALLDGGNTSVRGSSGDSTCTAGYTGSCTWQDATLPAEVFQTDVEAGNVTFRSKRGSPALVAPPRGIETSIRAFDAAPFELEAEFNKLDEHQGKASINEGLILLVPKY